MLAASSSACISLSPTAAGAPTRLRASSSNASTSPYRAVMIASKAGSCQRDEAT